MVVRALALAMRAASRMSFFFSPGVTGSGRLRRDSLYGSGIEA